MSDILDKEVLTTGEAARLCHVAPRTVSKWFDRGELRGYRIPGSRDRRIPMKSLMAFMRAHDIPLCGLDGGLYRVLLLEAGQDCTWADALARDSRFEFRRASNGFEAGVLTHRFRPHTVLIDVNEGDVEEAVGICRHVKASVELAAAKVVAVAPTGLAMSTQWFVSRGFDVCLLKPVAPEELAAVVERVTDLVG